MDPRRVRKGELLTGLAGLALLLFMFVGWYGTPGREAKTNAWESFAVVDILLAIAAVMAIAYLVATIVSRTAAVPQALAALTVLAAGLAALFVLYRVIDLPGPAGATRELGLALGVIATFAIAVAAWIGMRDESFPAALTPNLDVEVLPAPQPDGQRRASSP